MDGADMEPSASILPDMEPAALSAGTNVLMRLAGSASMSMPRSRAAPAVPVNRRLPLPSASVSPSRRALPLSPTMVDGAARRLGIGQRGAEDERWSIGNRPPLRQDRKS